MEEPVLSWSLLLAPRHYQGLQLSHNQQGAGPGLEPELEEIDLCLPTSFVSFQLATDHTTKAEAKQDDGRALPTPACSDSHPRGPSLHLRHVLQHLTPWPGSEPVGPAPSVLQKLPEKQAPSGSRWSNSCSKALHLTDPTAPSDSLYACCPSFYLGLRTAATSPHRPWHIVGAQ